MRPIVCILLILSPTTSFAFRCGTEFRPRDNPIAIMQAVLPGADAEWIQKKIARRVPRMFRNGEPGPLDLVFLHESYLKERLELIPQHLRSEAVELISSTSQDYVISTPGTHKAAQRALNQTGYIKLLKKIHVVLPLEYRNTVIEHAILIHEKEHALQHLFVREDPHDLGPKKFFSAFRFYEEQGAMRAEGAYLLLFPKDYLLTLRDRVERDINLPPETREFYNSMLEDASSSSSVLEYVGKQRRKGRYSRFQLLAEALKFEPLEGIDLIDLDFIQREPEN